jgi:Leucine-rich repeat (LRR) protein
MGVKGVKIVTDKLAVLVLIVAFILSAGVARAAVSADEKAALEDFYAFTNGASWTDSTNWLIGDPCDDSWHGVTCNGGTTVWSLYLPSNNLDGSIPPAIGNLTSLTQLELRWNQLTGSIPASIGSLTGLTDLEFSWNQLSGSIPASIGNLTSLTSLLLGDNNFSGGIPVELGNLPNLLYLDLNRSGHSGSMPSWIGNLTSLNYLNLSNNQLSGSIPSWIGDLTSLASLILSDNQLTGSMPTGLANLTNLLYLSLSANQLTGSIPTELGNLTNLDMLYLNGNQLTGSIPAELGNLTSLEDLFLSDNQLTGSIPSAIGNLTNLEYLSLYENQLTGSIPPEIGNLANIKQIYIFTNEFTGSIPVELGNLTILEYLFICNNQLTGSIPAELGNITSLKSLVLCNNQLAGSIPESFINLTNLTELELYGNNLIGEVPAGIMNTGLTAQSSTFGYNALYSPSGAVTSFLDMAQESGTFASTQTLAPRYPFVTSISKTSIQLYWTPDSYSQAGGYELWYSTVSGGSYSHFANTVDKTIITSTVTGLSPSTTYYFVLRTWTDAHANNSNKVTSEYSDVVRGTTSADVQDGGGSGSGSIQFGIAGSESDEKGSCFIATAAYGSYSESHVMALREFRDDVLLKSAAGTSLVDMYYTYSPPVADFIAERPALRVATRMALAPVVGAVKHPGAALVLMGFVFVGASVSLRQRRRKLHR